MWLKSLPSDVSGAPVAYVVDVSSGAIIGSFGSEDPKPLIERVTQRLREQARGAASSAPVERQQEERAAGAPAASAKEGNAGKAGNAGLSALRDENAALREQIERAREGVDPEQASPCLLYTSPSPRDGLLSRMPSSA